MKAHDRDLNTWYTKIQNWEIKLPRFQRHEAWDKRRISSLLETIINNLPLGVTLLLEVWDGEKFKSRYISTAEPINITKVTEHLLDWQQRLTAIWRTLHNNYEKDTYFIRFPELAKIDTRQVWKDEESSMIMIYTQPRWTRKDNNKTRYPFRCNNANETLERWLIPVDLFSPLIDSLNAKSRVEQALEKHKPQKWDEDFEDKFEYYHKLKEEILDKIIKIRESIKHYNLPYLSLPAQTEKEIALQVFINMNTNTKPLSIYDIIVAEIEMEEGSSLHELQDQLDKKYPHIWTYHPLSYLILYTSALLQEKMPNQVWLLNMNKSELIHNRQKTENWLNRLVSFLERQNIFDKQRLPTNAVLAVIAALYTFIPETWDKLGQDEILLKKYLWSSFFTDRYENSAASKAYADFIALKHILLWDTKKDWTKYTEEDVHVLNRIDYPLATEDELKTIWRPKWENIRGRGILAVSHLLWAYDFADSQQISRAHLLKREYHHIYPFAMLEKIWINGNLALNCALITGKTNRTISDKDPMSYIMERADRVQENVVNQRLNSYLIPIKELKSNDFEIFINARANYIKKAIDILTEWKQISIHDIVWKEKEKESIERIINWGENHHVEFKSSLRWDTKENRLNKSLEQVVLKVISSFNNADWWTLFIWVKDDWTILWLEEDYKILWWNKDEFELHLTNIIKNIFWLEFKTKNLKINFTQIENKEICLIDITPWDKPLYIEMIDKNWQKKKKFFARSGNSSQEFDDVEDMNNYINKKFK